MQPRRDLLVRAAIALLLAVMLSNAPAAHAQRNGLQPGWLQDALDDFWEDVFDDLDVNYDEPEIEIYDRDVATGCGETDRGAVPFYCPADNTVYIAEARYEAVVADRGEAYWVIEIANVWGTVVIWQVGLSDHDDDEPARSPDDAPGLNWCLGGAFVAAAVSADYLAVSDVEDGLTGLADDGYDGDLIERFITGYEGGAATCGLSAPGEAADEEPPPPAGDSPGRYVSPQYGYTIDYDPDTWQVYAEDSEPDDAYDTVVFTNGVSFIRVTGDPDYNPNQMDSCVDDYYFGLEGDENASDIEPLDAPDAFGEEDGRAWATYSYTYDLADGSEGEFILYYECFWLGDGLTIVIHHDTQAADYPGEIAARERFIAGVDTGRGPADGTA